MKINEVNILAAAGFTVSGSGGSQRAEKTNSDQSLRAVIKKEYELWNCAIYRDLERGFSFNRTFKTLDLAIKMANSTLEGRSTKDMRFGTSGSQGSSSEHKLNARDSKMKISMIVRDFRRSEAAGKVPQSTPKNTSVGFPPTEFNVVVGKARSLIQSGQSINSALGSVADEYSLSDAELNEIGKELEHQSIPRNALVGNPLIEFKIVLEKARSLVQSGEPINYALEIVQDEYQLSDAELDKLDRLLSGG